MDTTSGVLQSSGAPPAPGGTSPVSSSAVAQVTKTWREAIDHCSANLHRYAPKPAWMSSLDKLAEGQQHTLGAYHRPWK